MVGLGHICSFLAAASVAGASRFPREQSVLGSTPWSSGSQNAAHVRDELKKAGIISTVLDDFTPTHLLKVEWSSHNTASLGNTLKPKKLQDAPTITLTADSSAAGHCKSDTTFVIAATDPDAPSRDDPKWSEFCHWIATGVAPASSEAQGGCGSLTIKGLEEVMSYKPPGPPEKTGKHRYVFVVYTPANGTTAPLHLTKPKGRQNWGTGKERHGVRDWAGENGLEPVAANFIYAENEKQ